MRAVPPSRRFVNGSPPSEQTLPPGSHSEGSRSAIAVAMLALPFVLTETSLVC